MEMRQYVTAKQVRNNERAEYLHSTQGQRVVEVCGDTLASMGTAPIRSVWASSRVHVPTNAYNVARYEKMRDEFFFDLY